MTPTDPAPSAAEVKERLKDAIAKNPARTSEYTGTIYIEVEEQTLTAALSLIERGELEREPVKTMHIGRTDAIAVELCRVMKENCISQADLARKLKLSRQLISRWLDPKNDTNFVASTLQMIAEAIGAEVIVYVKNAARAPKEGTP